MIADDAVWQPPLVRSAAAVRAAGDSDVAPSRAEAVTMIGAESVSTRAVRPMGSKVGSAAAERVRVGSEEPSVGSDSEAAARESAAVSPAVMITEYGQVPRPHHWSAAASWSAAPEVRSGVVKG